MRMLCLAAEADPTGYVLIGSRPVDATDLARLTGASEAEVTCLMSELDRNGVYSRDRKGRIYNRRMVRDDKLRRQAQQNGKLGGNPTLGKETTKPPGVNPYDKGRHKTQSLSRRPKPKTEIDKSLEDTPSVAARPLGCVNGVNRSDPANRKAIWFNRVSAYVRAKLPAERYENLMARYLEGDASAKREWEGWSQQEATERKAS